MNANIHRQNIKAVKLLLIEIRVWGLRRCESFSLLLYDPLLASKLILIEHPL